MTTPTTKQIDNCLYAIKTYSPHEVWQNIHTIERALTAKDARIKELELNLTEAANILTGLNLAATASIFRKIALAAKE